MYADMGSDGGGPQPIELAILYNRRQTVAAAIREGAWLYIANTFLENEHLTFFEDIVLLL